MMAVPRSPLRCDRHEGVFLLTIDRPPVNAINSALSRALSDAFLQYRSDATLRVAILIGVGEYFSAGLDLREAAEAAGGALDYGRTGFGGLTEMFDLHKPVIAAVNGHAIGAGFELLLAADLVVASEGVKFWLPETRRGIVADAGGILRLPRRLPYALAMELLLTDRKLSADEARHFGVVNDVVPSADLLPRALDLARSVAEGAPLAVFATMEVVHSTVGLPLEQACVAKNSGSLPYYEQMKVSTDAQEGMRAFLEKRPPRFSGC